MPVTFCPAPQSGIRSYPHRPYGSQTDFKKSTSTSLLASVYKNRKHPMVEHLQSSFGCEGTRSVPITPCTNGFVDTVMKAYSHHHALIIRPDDVWTAILTQFSLFVNGEGRAERLRYLFVAHEGKKRLEINLHGCRDTVDFGEFALLMTGKIQENVVDPELRDWILPDFSTTTPNDTVVGSVVMMATLKTYFEYYGVMWCGLPRVTLLGTQDDWLRIFHRVGKLGRYGAETAAWRDLLRPVLARFVRAFEPGYAESKENLNFWQRVVHEEPYGSGTEYLSGWITAFCAFSAKGRWLGSKSRLSQDDIATEAALSSYEEEGFTYRFGKIEHKVKGHAVVSPLKIDGVEYHRLDTSDVPTAAVEVEVTLDDHGEKVDCMMVAGVIGTSVSDAALVQGGVVKNGEIAPASAWWMFTVEETREETDSD